MSKDALKYSLQALAQPSEFQQRLLRVWLDNPAELPERFVHAHRHFLSKCMLTNLQENALQSVHVQFQAFSGPANAEHWQVEALTSSPHWESVRQVARTCLEAFGWPADEPPLDRVSYGDDFHEHSAA